jgi:hypothetical protein
LLEQSLRRIEATRGTLHAAGVAENTPAPRAMGNGPHCAAGSAALDRAAGEHDGHTSASRHPANLAVCPNGDDGSSNVGAPTSADHCRSDDAAPPRPSGVGGKLPPTTVAGNGTPGAGGVSRVGEAGPSADELRRTRDKNRHPGDASRGLSVGACGAPVSATVQRN